MGIEPLLWRCEGIPQLLTLESHVGVHKEQNGLQKLSVFSATPCQTQLLIGGAVCSQKCEKSRNWKGATLDPTSDFKGGG